MSAKALLEMLFSKLKEDIIWDFMIAEEYGGRLPRGKSEYVGIQMCATVPGVSNAGAVTARANISLGLVRRVRDTDFSVGTRLVSSGRG